MSDPHNTVQTDFTAHEWTDDDEGEATQATPTERVKEAREASAKPAEEPDLESDEPDLVDSEGKADDDAPPDEGHASDTAPDKDTAVEAPETADAGHARKWAGKHDTPEQLESAYENLQSLKGRLDNQLQQSQYQVKQLQEQLTQVQRVTARAPQFDSLPAEEQNRLAQEALDEDPYLRDNPEEWKRRASEIGKQEWKAEQQALKLLERGSAAHQAEARESALYGLVEYGKALEKHGDHVLNKFAEHPELFEIIRQLEPRAIERTGKKLLDLFANAAELESLKTSQGARDAAMRQAGREESRKTEARKDAASSVASTASSVKTAAPSAKPATPKPASTLARILDSARDRDTSGDWE